MTTVIGLLANTTYELSWYYQPRTNGLGDNLIEAFIAGPLQTLFANPRISFGDSQRVVGTTWVLITDRFTTGSAGNYSLTFRAGGRENSLGGFVDNVSVAVVPLPAGGLLLLGGLGALAVAARRRRAAA
jgi:hypothetical protein